MSPGIMPRRTEDPEEVFALVREDGAAILSSLRADEQTASRLPSLVFGSALREVADVAQVLETGAPTKRPSALDRTVRLDAHTDGFSYGDAYPDHFFLLCAATTHEGGESFLVDGYAVLDALAAIGGNDTLVSALGSVPVDQTEPDKRAAVSPIVQTARDGRRMLRRFPFQRPARGSTDRAADQEMIDVWRDAVAAASELAPRFKLMAGDAIAVDNYRCLHGREPYTDGQRKMWRVWCWTERCPLLPPGRLHSDSRYAAAL